MLGKMVRLPKVSWFQFGLRAMMLVMLAVAIGLGVWCDRASRLRTTVAALESLGVEVFWDHEPEPAFSFFQPPRQRPQANLLATRLGREYFHHPVSAVVHEATPSDEVVRHLQSLPSLKTLYVSTNHPVAADRLRVNPDIKLYIVQRGRCGDVFVEPHNFP